MITFSRCPKPVNRKDNETECNEGTKVCQGGECKGSICLKFGMDQVILHQSIIHLVILCIVYPSIGQINLNRLVLHVF